MQAARRRGGWSGRRLLLLEVTPHVGWHRRRHRLLPRLTVAMHGGGRRVGEPRAGGAKPNATPHSADWGATGNREMDTLQRWMVTRH